MSLTRTRRALVLSDEQARHPFRRSLPPRIRGALIAKPASRSMRQTIVEDWRSFLATYCATFVLVSVFVA